MPGDKLPSERELAAMMKVGRPALREALRGLALMNVVEIRHGDGTYVTSLEPDRLVEHLDFVFSLDDHTFLDLLDARKVLEVGLVMLAAERITDDEIAALEAGLVKSRQAQDSPDEFLQLDIDLHMGIAAASRNTLLSSFMNALGRLGMASRRRTVTLPGVPAQSIKDHEAIINALKARDPEAARQAMLAHLSNIEQKLKRVAGSNE